MPIINSLNITLSDCRCNQDVLCLSHKQNRREVLVKTQVLVHVLSTCPKKCLCSSTRVVTRLFAATLKYTIPVVYYKHLHGMSDVMHSYSSLLACHQSGSTNSSLLVYDAG